MLEIVDLTVKYDRVILDRINLELSDGIYGMAGITGSGKTTFIKAVLGLIRYRLLINLNNVIGSLSPFVSMKRYRLLINLNNVIDNQLAIWDIVKIQTLDKFE